MKNSTGRRRIAFSSLAAVAIIVGAIVIGAMPRTVAMSSPSGKQVPTAPANTYGDKSGAFEIKEYSEFGSALDADLPSTDLPGLVFDLGAKLVFVLLLVFFVIRLLKRYLFQNTTLAQNKKHVSLLESLNLSPQRTVYVLEVGRKLLVVGASQTQLSLLAEITDPDAIEEMRAQSNTIPQQDQFLSLVNVARRRFGDRETAPSVGDVDRSS